MSVQQTIPKADSNQLDYALLALLRTGGAQRLVDIEHVAVEAHKLAPTLFCWRHYPELPSIEVVRLALRDSTRRSSEALFLTGDRGHSRMLTAGGLSRARRAEDLLGLNANEPSDGSLRRPVNRELLKMERHPAFAKWQLEGLGKVNRYDLADLLACSPSSPKDVFLDRLERARTVATDWSRNELAQFLADCIDRLSLILKEVGA